MRIDTDTLHAASTVIRSHARLRVKTMGYPDQVTIAWSVLADELDRCARELADEEAERLEAEALEMEAMIDC